MLNQLILSRILHQLSLDRVNNFFNPRNEQIRQDFGGQAGIRLVVNILALPMQLVHNLEVLVLVD